MQEEPQKTEIEKVDVVPKEETEVVKEQVRTTRKKAEFLEYLERGMGIVKLACDAIDISRQTYYDWYKEDERFKREVERIKRLQLDDVEDKLLKAIVKEESWAIAFYLGRRHPTYRPKQENYIIPTEKTLEDLLDEYEQKNEPTIEQNIDRETPEDSEQAGSTSPVQNEPGATVLPEQKDEEKPDIESPAKGDQQVH